MESKNIFLIGPASVGKSTVAELLAKKIGYSFIDLDQEFCEQIESIPTYIKSRGYPAYCEANSKLFKEIITLNPHSTVVATSAGFLVHEEVLHIANKNREMIKEGLSVLLLLGGNPLQDVEVIVDRQMKRWNDILDPKVERERFISRHHVYKNYGDIQIFSKASPLRIVQEILEALS